MNGAVVNLRGKGDKLAVWLSDCTDSEAVVSINNYWCTAVTYHIILGEFRGV